MYNTEIIRYYLIHVLCIIKPCSVVQSERKDRVQTRTGPEQATRDGSTHSSTDLQKQTAPTE